MSAVAEQAQAPHQPAARRLKVPRLARLAAAAAWRRVWHLDDVLRQAFWSQDPGFATRATTAPRAIRALAPPLPRTRRSAAPAGRGIAVGTSSGGTERSAFTAVAGLYGVELDGAPFSESAALNFVDLESPFSDSHSGERLRRYLFEGGTVYATGTSARASAGLVQLENALSVGLPRLRELSGPGVVRFPSHRADFAAELAGVALAGAEPPAFLTPVAGATVLAWIDHAGEASPGLTEFEIGQGRLLIGAGGDHLAGRPADAYGPRHALTVLPPMMTIRRLFGQAAWHPAVRTANVTVDDPALRVGLLGLDFPKLLEDAERLDFHLTAATIPRELGLSDAGVLRLLRSKPARLSACHHGNDHSGYEFYAAQRGRHRFRHRSLAEQRRALREAVGRSRSFAAATGVRLDRVMVFPHGLCAESMLPALQDLGFLASCNWLDRYPLEALVPDDTDLGMRPADTAWEGFPLLWRRQAPDGGVLLDLFLGRPALLFCHPQEVRGGLPAELLQRVAELNAAGAGQVAWRGLEEVARHAYLQRRLADGSWEVLMTANEACLHNPDPEPRTYRVTRPHLPAGSRLSSAVVTVASGTSGLVRVLGGRVAAQEDVLPDGAGGCSIFPG